MDIGEIRENLERIVELFEYGSTPEELLELISLIGFSGGFVVIFIGFLISILPYLLASILNAVVFALAPAIWFVIKKMKESNAHGDSTSEFRHLRGSKMKMLYQNDTIFYLQYLKECDELGIGSRDGR